MTTARPTTSARQFTVAGVGALLAAAYFLHPPPVPDLAAQTAWADLFQRVDLVPYFARWYAGTSAVGYSLLSPAVLGSLGPAGAGAIALLAATAAALPLCRTARRPAVGAGAIVFATWLNLLSGRVTFTLGASAALCTLAATRSRRTLLAAPLGLLALGLSPVAGLLLLVPLAAVAVCLPDLRRTATVVALTIAAGLVVLHLVSPVNGREPFAVGTLSWCLAVLVGAIVLPVARIVRVGALLALPAVLAAFFLATPVGGNVSRLVALGAIPAVAATIRLNRWPTALIALGVAAGPAVQAGVDITNAFAGATSPDFTQHVAQQLSADPLTRTHRVEIVDTPTHWPDARLIPQLTLARGWERQVDEERNPLFYGRAPLDPSSYRHWLDSRAVALVAVPRTAALDHSSRGEAGLIRRGLDYLRPVWKDAGWTLYAVRRPASIITGAASVVALTDTGMRVRATRPGRIVVRLAWSPFLTVDGGRVVGGDNNSTRIDLYTAGVHNVHGVWRWP
jgi:hypothetical protein